jgi:hypothetical protein
MRSSRRSQQQQQSSGPRSVLSRVGAALVGAARVAVLVAVARWFWARAGAESGSRSAAG